MNLSLIQAAEKNHFEAFSSFSKLPGGNLENLSMGWRLSTPICHSLFNGIFLTKSQSGTKDFILENIEFFKSRGLPFHWWSWPSSENSLFLGQSLLEAGFQKTSSPSLYLNRKTSPSISANEAADLHQVKNPKLLDAWLEIFQAGFNFSAEASGALKSWINLNLNSKNHCHFVKYRKGDAAACSSAILTNNGMGSIFNVATKSHLRKQGLGTSISAEAARWLFENGAKTIFLTSSPQALEVYKGLGFREFCELEIYDSK